MIKRQHKNPRRHQQLSPVSRRRGKFALIVLGIMLIGYGLMSCSWGKVDNADNNDNVSNTATTLPAPEDSEAKKIIELTDALDGSDTLAKFSHGNEYHQRVTCLACHSRDDNSAAPRLPGKAGHTPCIGCHTKQFEDKQSLVCTICHSDTEKGTMKNFPPLRSFNAKFDHATHLGKANCASCHKPAKKGVAKTIPSGLGTHTTCFGCHSSDKGLEMSSCSVCHQPGRPGRRASTTAKAFKVNFSHARHKMNCTACHKVLRGAAKGRQVASPLASMHFPPRNRLTCATCHNNKRAFGGDDFSDCRRCHTGSSFRFP